jgi:tetratricopeptide (TPR) repeat protein
MKFSLAKSSAAILLLFLMASISAADPAVVELLSAGRMNDVIRVLAQRDDPESLHLLSRAYYAIENWDEAVRNGERAVSLRQDDASYHLWLAREYGQKAAVSSPLKAAGIARKAKNEFERAVLLDPSNVQAHGDLAEYYVEAPAIMGGGLDKARDQAAAVRPYDPAMSHWILGKIAEKEKHWDDAEREYRAGVKVAKDPAEYWMHLASLYRERGRLDEMQRTVQTAIAQPDKSAETYYNAATVLYDGGRDFPAAVQYLKQYLASGQMVEDAPGFRAHYLLGQVYQSMGDRSAAMAEYQAALRLASGFAPAQAALSKVQ